jgi:thymidylate synthase
MSEQQYLDLLKDCVINGNHVEGRNGVTLSTFGVRMEFDVSETVPAMTTKRLAWKTVIKELLWFVSGDTSNKTLNDMGVHIWDGNSSREYLDDNGFEDREEGELGPIYGYQWRNWGGLNIDQLKNCVESIKTNPHSRRHIISAWNVGDIPKMALPPCHLLYQFYVNGDKLDIQMYQRSGDAFLGVPFNIFSYTVLLYMVAHVTGLKPGRFIHVIGNFHIYNEHLNVVNKQLLRTPLEFPRLEITRDVKDIDDFKLSDFKLVGYKHKGSLRAKMKQ